MKTIYTIIPQPTNPIVQISKFYDFRPPTTMHHELKKEKDSKQIKDRLTKYSFLVGLYYMVKIKYQCVKVDQAKQLPLNIKNNMMYK
jgi:hypothetical protein